MKALAIVAGAAVCLLGFCLQAEAVTTVTFDNLGTGVLWEKQYLTDGVENAPHPWNFDTDLTNDVPPDGWVNDSGLGGKAAGDKYVVFAQGAGGPIPPGVDSNGVAWTTSGGGGVMEFTEAQTSISMDVISSGAGTVSSVSWFAGPESNPQLYTGSFSARTSWKTKTIAPGGSFDSLLIANISNSQPWAMDNLTFEEPAATQYTGIQVVSLTSDITGALVSVGDTVTFTVTAVSDMSIPTINYQFWTRAGYGITEPMWGGNKWQSMPWSTTNTQAITFDTAGIYIVAVHLSADNSWAFGSPQIAVAVEVQ